MLLEMKNLCKTYGETIALDRLNLQLTPGICWTSWSKWCRKKYPYEINLYADPTN